MMKKNKNEYTGDLFGVEDCLMCKGTGQYTTYNSEIGGVEYITDCEECGGTGEVNYD
jgi:DnaJ-class molecular chaperone